MKSSAKLTWQDVEKALAPLDTTSAKLKDPTPPQADQISTDSQSIKNGQWFFPLKGEHFDGHQFISNAVQNGSQGFFCNPQLVSSKELMAMPHIAIKDTNRGFQQYASAWRNLFQIPLVAISGSCGKTTTKDILASCLEQLGPVLRTAANFNNEIGVPKTLLELSNNHKFAILEMGARHQGDLGLLVNIARPTVSCLLNAKDAHVGEFGSIDALRAAKLELLSASPKDTICIVGHDDEILLDLARRQVSQTLLTFGEHPEATARVISSKPTPKGMTVTIEVASQQIEFHLPFFHTAMAQNLAAITAIGHAFKITDLASFSRGATNYQPAGGRFRITQFERRVLIDDSYNASPASMIAGATSAAATHAGKKLMLVLGDMLELGEQAARSHATVGEDIADLKPYGLITIGDISHKILESCQRKYPNLTNTAHFQNVEELITANPSALIDADVVYIKGSRGVRLDRLVEDLSNKFQQIL